MKRISLLVALISIIVTQLPGSANAALIVYPPVLDKVVINSDSMQAVLYWRLTHSAADNPVAGYAASYNGSYFFAISHSLTTSNVSLISLPTRANTEPYLFSIAPITKKGVGPASNQIKMEINPFTIPSKISEVSSTLGGFSFNILDFAEPGHSNTRVLFSITDIEGSESAYLRSPQNSGLVEIAGIKQGEKVKLTLYKNVAICDGFIVQFWCPYSSLRIIEGQGTSVLPTPYCVEIFSESNGFSCQLRNYDSNINYSVDAPEGVGAYITSGGILQVSEMQPSSTISLNIKSQYPNYDAVETIISGRALDEASEIDTDLELSEPISTHVGFYTMIRNFNPQFDYEAASSIGTVSIYGDGVVEVRGLAAKGEATVTVTKSSGGEVLSESSIEGSSKPQRGKNKKK